MAEQAMRAVLLARAGVARDQLSAALADAGADVVLVADPLTSDLQTISDAQPQAIVIALEPAIENALERYDVMLSDPAITVIFDDAELAPRRSEWEAARWRRHLAAKLHRHDDVLPPRDENRVPAIAETDAASDRMQVAGGLQLVDSDELLASLAGQHASEPTRTASDGEAGHAASARHDIGRTALEFGADRHITSSRDPAAGVEKMAAAAEPLNASRSAEGSVSGTASSVAHDLDALEQRASALSLADVDSYGHGPVRGAVWIEGGLGAPDALRQLLGALPETFPRPIVVRLLLDGGRYDRLVRQMARATSLAVALAEPGQPLEAGNAYFMTPAQSVDGRGAGFVFADVADADMRFAALPADDSALLFLSGSDAAQVDAAAAWTSPRGLLAAQTPDSCYDAAAVTALIARGAESDAPAQLAARLVARWPS